MVYFILASHWSGLRCLSSVFESATLAPVYFSIKPVLAGASFNKWCLRSELNGQPLVFQTSALTANELLKHMYGGILDILSRDNPITSCAATVDTTLRIPANSIRLTRNSLYRVSNRLWKCIYQHAWNLLHPLTMGVLPLILRRVAEAIAS